MARTLRGDNLHIATGQLGYHVLDTMAAIEESAERHQFIKVTSTVDPSPRSQWISIRSLQLSNRHVLDIEFRGIGTGTIRSGQPEEWGPPA
jgi:acetoacetate decarboxylase